MKISLTEIREIPNNIGKGFCVFGKPKPEVVEWINHHDFKTVDSDRFTNIIIDKPIKEIFYPAYQFEYIDGFSPNLNKHLHLGHLSNFVLAKTFQSLNIGKKFIAIFGDTLKITNVTKDQALDKYYVYCNDFGYRVDEVYFASEMQYEGNLLHDGEDKYKGTKIFKIGKDKLVGIKSDNTTTYFYQDVALASHLNAPTLYMTGQEQIGHFKLLKKLFPNVNHCALGLVTLNGKKQSSREGNVIYAQDVFNTVGEIFEDKELQYNVIAGQILKSAPISGKDIDINMIQNPQTSIGLYFSYAMARLVNAGCNITEIEDYSSPQLQFSHLRSQIQLSPNHLVKGLKDLCSQINIMYDNKKIKGNPENKKEFEILLNDLNLGMKSLGLFPVSSV